jgi:hypothetical protein
MADEGITYDLTDPETKHRARPRAAAPAAAGPLPPETVARYMADPTQVPTDKTIATSGLDPNQQKAIRDAWPILKRPLAHTFAPGEQETNQKRSADLDTLLSIGEHVYGERADKTMNDAIKKHYEWISERKRRGTTEGALGASVAGGLGIGSNVKATDADPLLKLKGPARDRAFAASGLIDIMAKNKGAEADPEALITRHLPLSSDTPENVASKRGELARQAEELAQGLPSNDWRRAIRHTIRARALGRGGLPGIDVMAPPAEPGAAGAPVAPGATPQQPSVTQPTSSEPGNWDATKRGLISGASTLSVPAMAAIAHAMSVVGGGRAPYLAGAPAEAVGGQGPEYPFREALHDVKGGVSQATMGETPEQTDAGLAAARERSPMLTGGAELAGGLVDPTTYALGPLMQLGKLSPVAKNLIGHAMAGGASGALSSAGETGAPTVRATLIGMGAGAILGKLGGKLLDSPADAKVIKSITEKYADEIRATSGEVAAKRAAVTDVALGSPEERAVTTGGSKAIQERGPQLVDERNALLKEHGAGAWKPQVVAIEDAIEHGDVKAAEELRAKLVKLGAGSDSKEIKSLTEDLDRIFTKREVLAAAKAGQVGHHAQAAGGHPFVALSDPNAGLGTQLPALGREISEGYGKRGAFALVSGKMGALTGVPIRTAKQGLAKLWIARQNGDATMMQQAMQEAIKVGVPFTVVNQIAGHHAGSFGSEPESGL